MNEEEYGAYELIDKEAGLDASSVRSLGTLFRVSCAMKSEFNASFGSRLPIRSISLKRQSKIYKNQIAIKRSYDSTTIIE